MNRIILILTFLLALGTNNVLKADASYNGHVSLKGILGESTQFELEMEYFGDGPCLVKGQTIYTRKNGSQSKIPVYGIWECETSGRMQISEVLNGKVCGTFDFIIDDMPCDENVDTFSQPVDGSWKLGNKEMKFKDVIRFAPNEKYEATNFMEYLGTDIKKAGGIYSYNYIGNDSSNPIDQRTLRLRTSPETSSWDFSLIKQDQFETFEADRTQGYGNVPGIIGNWTSFGIGNADFDAVVMDDVLMIYQCNPECVPDGTIPAGFSIEGIYVKEADLFSAYAEHFYSDTDPELKSYTNVSVFYPRVSGKALNDSISAWFLMRLEGSNRDLNVATQQAADGYIASLPEIGEMVDDDQELESWMCWFQESNLSYSGYLEPKVINLCYYGYDHQGGVHGMPFSTTCSVRRSDGKCLDWSFFFSNPDSIIPLVDKYMREQNEEVEFFADTDETLGLPGDSPWLENGCLVFHFGAYEAAPYLYGEPTCSIPVAELMKYLTPQAQKLVK